ncbi:hypothetical protein NC653_025085 [Populus alba x Populus x berolinensis]|uniref:Uncharacterized protein n=1 Tax=Populus alba x Populus x berolinensis TaxID=444605 RepID=A0AAD6MAG4_9ROSI|nr:hypothetical protein NC653_025085 [Populus alba x Populus x berolinensis]
METSPSCWILDSGWQAEAATSMLTLKLHKQAVTLVFYRCSKQDPGGATNPSLPES